MARDVQANLNESNFLKSSLVGCQCPRDAIYSQFILQVETFNQTYGSGPGATRMVTAFTCTAIVHEDNPIDSRFSLLLNDFSEDAGWHQVVQTDLVQTRATLQALARMHAFFWLGDKTEALASSLWPIATYWDQAKQPADQANRLSTLFARFVADFGDPGVAEAAKRKDYGALLALHAERLEKEVHQGEKQTIIHGDAKSANFFYKTGSSGEEGLEVGVIDFQWTGRGLCATDVAYAMWACPQSEVLDQEQQLLEFYHGQLAQELAKEGSKVPSLLTFKAQYQAAFLDLCRVVIADHWSTVTPSTLAARAAMPDVKRKVFNAYNKDVGVAKRLQLRMMEELDIVHL